MGEIYKGIDLTLKAYGNNVEKLFTILPKENPDLTRIRVTGAKGLKVNKKGELEIVTELGPVRFTKPSAYQNIGGKKRPVEVAYVVYEGNTYGFRVGNYDKNSPLIIDPLLASTLIGGSAREECLSIALDGSGHVYVTGLTESSEYPTSSGVYDESFNGSYDAFVSKLDGGLSSVLASTFIGGTAGDNGHSIVLDGSGNVYVTGVTYCSDYPTTSGAYDESYNGGAYDVFASKLNSGLSSLLASTFIGGSDEEIGYSIVLDGSGHVYVTGLTYSSNYPTTSGAYDESYNDGGDVFISKLNSGLSALLASTFIGGSAYDDSFSIVLDGSENVYVTGYAYSTDYPTTSGAYDESYNGGAYDVFASKLNSGLSSLLASTFIGGSDEEIGYSIVLDGSGHVYVTGLTYSSNYPTTSGAYDESFNGSYDAFVSKLDGGLSSVLASTFIGGTLDDRGLSIALDGSENVYVTGYAYSTDYPTTSGAYDESYNGDYDAFVSKLDSNLSVDFAVKQKIMYDGYLDKSQVGILADTLIVVNNWQKGGGAIPVWIEVFDKHGNLQGEQTLLNGGEFLPGKMIPSGGFGWITLGMIVSRVTQNPLGSPGGEKFFFKISTGKGDPGATKPTVVQVKQVTYTSRQEKPGEAIWDATLIKSWAETALGGRHGPGLVKYPSGWDQ